MAFSTFQVSKGDPLLSQTNVISTHKCNNTLGAIIQFFVHVNVKTM